MPEPEKSTVDRLATIQGNRLRRDILGVAREAHAAGRLVSPMGLSRQLKAPVGRVSYHVKVLREEGALKLLDEVPRRGAQEHLYGINEELLAEIGDSVALDQIAELIDGLPGPKTKAIAADEIAQIIRATGRPVEA